MSTTCTECDREFSRKDIKEISMEQLIRLHHHHHHHRVMKKNPIIFWKPIIRFCFGIRTETIPIISCHPFTSVISGSTGRGKSVFVRRFLHNIKHMMTPIPDRILWCYGEYQTVYGTVDGVDFQQGLPDFDNLDPREKHLIILDDLMDETDQRVASLFTKKNHHRNISVMYIVQNLFHRGKHHRTN